jgi:hypothetical protein
MREGAQRLIARHRQDAAIDHHSTGLSGVIALQPHQDDPRL